MDGCIEGLEVGKGDGPIVGVGVGLWVVGMGVGRLGISVGWLDG